MRGKILTVLVPAMYIGKVRKWNVNWMLAFELPHDVDWPWFVYPKSGKPLPIPKWKCHVLQGRVCGVKR